MPHPFRLPGLLAAMLACAAAAAPPCQVVAVDTSGSMQSHYRGSGDGPNTVTRLVLELIAHMPVTSPLVLFSFDHVIHDRPEDLVVVRAVDPVAVRREIEGLRLTQQQGRGTARTAALGRAVGAVASLKQPAGPAAVIYLITDRDRDAAPAPPTAAWHELVANRRRQGALRPLARAMGKHLVIEAWQLGPQAAVDQDRLERLVAMAEESPEQLGTGLDLATRGLEIRPLGEWQPGDSGELVQTVELRSTFERLTFAGKVDATAKVAGAPDARAALRFEQATPRLSPGAEIAGRLSLTGLPRANWFATGEEPLTVDWRFEADGLVTDTPAVLDKSDPAAVALLSGAALVTWRRSLAAAPLGTPYLQPPRWLQGLVLSVIFAIGCVVSRRRRPGNLDVHVRVGDGVGQQTVGLQHYAPKRLDELPISLKRASGSSVTVTALEGATVCKAGGQPAKEATVERRERLVVQRPGLEEQSLEVSVGERLPEAAVDAETPATDLFAEQSRRG